MHRQYFVKARMLGYCKRAVSFGKSQYYSSHDDDDHDKDGM